jgi:hypothetical protein
VRKDDLDAWMQERAGTAYAQMRVNLDRNCYSQKVLKFDG